MSSDVFDGSQSSLFAGAPQIGDEVELTHEERVKAIAAQRPRYLDRTPIGTEHIRWAICELEREGVHPSLKLIIQVIGRGSQREVVPFVNEFYRIAAAEAPRHPIDEHGGHLKALYEVVLSRARESVLVEFDADRVALQEAWDEVDAKQKSAQASAQAAADTLRLAEAVNALAREELDKSRVQHVEIQERLITAAANLAKSERALLASEHRVGVLIDQRDAAQAIRRKSEEGLHHCHAQLSASRQREAFLRKALKHATDQRSATEIGLRDFQRRLDQERLLAHSSERNLRNLARKHTRLGSNLVDIQSRLARSRLLAGTLSKSIEGIQADNALMVARLRIEQRARAFAELERAVAGRELELTRTELERTNQSLDRERERLAKLQSENRSLSRSKRPRTE